MSAATEKTNLGLGLAAFVFQTLGAGTTWEFPVLHRQALCPAGVLKHGARAWQVALLDTAVVEVFKTE